jgi:hypothetical protein
LSRIDGTTVYLPAEPANPEDLAMYMFQQLAHPDCAVLTIRNWGALPDSGLEEEIVWRTQAAECLYLAMFVGMKMELLARTNDPQYTVTPEDLSRVASRCPQSAASWSPQPPGGRPSAYAGVSVGQAPVNFARMAADANSGTLHPAHVLTGRVFR